MKRVLLFLWEAIYSGLITFAWLALIVTILFDITK